MTFFTGGSGQAGAHDARAGHGASPGRRSPAQLSPGDIIDAGCGGVSAPPGSATPIGAPAAAAQHNATNVEATRRIAQRQRRAAGDDPDPFEAALRSGLGRQTSFARQA